ncbi:DUF448 domain-containing protein [Campylobacter sp. VicNov18]|uniref:DUF448 domain-containing protein n=1 Tax=Campylobacter bilis TaxID=2691918 RepID=UPI00130DAEDC|nr:DUF448 domain-containing protein [Campylobacter bilis]MPV63012.1 DUF448 domain-containing protein [Campylobacter hepaticus]MBM0636511.1 DUF448 domain-containing protein [Campylobacter bilis]MCC8277221.1 DUF448 domain-containing protein [Campylobacter bilis]MCC8298964.1 DUF448 domain-containing protein [Campylobacter bilis]MCC8300130.1 DUF448 domain-containing protein [Campylobacter bilis]
MKKHIPIRMCIVCKNRFEKNVLLRFKIVLGDISTKTECGRSLYLCQNCIEKQDKILQRAFSKICKNLNTKITQQGLKEIFLNGKN